MKLVKIFAGLLLTFGVAAAHGEPITVTSHGGIFTEVADATTIDFNGNTTLFPCGGYASCSGDYKILTGSVTSHYAQPPGTGNSQYLTVPYANSNGSALFTLGTTADYFGLYWGSADDYNYISFFLDGVQVGSTFNGFNVSPPANGDQAHPLTNRYINFFFNDGLKFNSVELSSTNYAFESDNHAYRAIASVPEPATAMLMLLGLLGLMGARKRQR